MDNYLRLDAAKLSVKTEHNLADLADTRSYTVVFNHKAHRCFSIRNSSETSDSSPFIFIPIMFSARHWAELRNALFGEGISLC